MTLDILLKKCLENPNISIEKSPNNIKLLLEHSCGKGLITFFPVFPGISLAYIFVASPNWPAPDLFADNPTGKGPLILNCCISGRCELLLDNGNYIYLQNNSFSITERFARNQYVYPGNHYEGLEFFIDKDIVYGESEYLWKVFHLPLKKLEELYCPNGTTYISSIPPKSLPLFRRLWSLYETQDDSAIFQMQITTLELLKSLLSVNGSPQSQVCEFFTASQVEIAKKAEQLITSDLRRHYPVREIAAAFSISETSVKNYFRGVYGQNISVYLRELRMNTAAQLLIQSRLSVSEIAEKVGYLNQSKFASVFKRQFNMTPLEYRRTKQIEAFRQPPVYKPCYTEQSEAPASGPDLHCSCCRPPAYPTR